MTKNTSERAAPELPVFIVEGHDVTTYESLDRAEGDLEPIDVKAGIYVGYDAHGRRLRIETDGGSTFITLDEVKPTRATELEDVLRDHLEAMGEPSGRDAECDLPCLVEAAREHASESRLGTLLRLFTRLGRPQR